MARAVGQPRPAPIDTGVGCLLPDRQHHVGLVSVWAFVRRCVSRRFDRRLSALLPGALTLPIGAWVADPFPRRRGWAPSSPPSCWRWWRSVRRWPPMHRSPLSLPWWARASVTLTPYRPADLALVPFVSPAPRSWLRQTSRVAPWTGSPPSPVPCSPPCRRSPEARRLRPPRRPSPPHSGWSPCSVCARQAIPRQPPASFPNRRWQRCRAAFVFSGTSAIRRSWWAVS